MANAEHIAILEMGVDAWNEWRKEIRDTHSDLRPAGLELPELEEWLLSLADLSRANLTGQNLDNADLSEANLGRADLSGTNFDSGVLGETIFADVDLRTVKNLDRVQHLLPSIIDYRTLERSGQLPLVFLRGVGLPDRLIDYLPSLTGEAIQYCSCFISYLAVDQEFAARLHADLQDKGVRCWFAPKDLKIGAKTLDAIDRAIRFRDKLLLVLSETSIDSEWVEREVTMALAEEISRNKTILFPIRIDDAIWGTDEPWATLIKDTRNIGDFTGWKDHDTYQKGLDRLLRDLAASPNDQD